MKKREIPHSREAEESLVGSVLISPRAIYELPNEPEEFFIHRNRFVWEAYQRLKQANISIDYVTVGEELERNNHLEEVGGPAYLVGLINRVPSALHALEYSKIVRETFIRRKTLELANQLAKAAYNEESDILTERTDIAQSLTEVAGMRGAVPVSVWSSRIYDQISEWVKNPRSNAGISTGFSDFDEVLGDGLMTGVNLLGGRPGQGKSILAQNVAENLADSGIPGAFYSAEMRWEDLMLRILSKRTKIKVSDFRKGNIEEYHWHKVTSELEKLQKTPLYVDDPKGMTCAELRADLTRLKAQHNIKWMVFDYMELLGDKYPYSKDWERSAKLARELVVMTTALDIKALVIQKLNKDGWSGEVDLNNFAGGSDLAYDVVNALILTEHIPDVNESSDGNMRTVVNVKQQRLVEQTRKACNLYKDPAYPKFYVGTYMPTP